MFHRGKRGTSVLFSSNYCTNIFPWDIILQKAEVLTLCIFLVWSYHESCTISANANRVNHILVLLWEEFSFIGFSWKYLWGPIELCGWPLGAHCIRKYMKPSQTLLHVIFTGSTYDRNLFSSHYRFSFILQIRIRNFQ